VAVAVGSGGASRATQHGIDARRQLGRVERLGQIVVGAQLQAADAGLQVAARRDDDDRHV